MEYSLRSLFQEIDSYQQEIIETLGDLIHFQTVNTGLMPTGNELPLCEYLAKKLAADGIESQILKSADNRGNLIARLPGNKHQPRLLLMGHTDVVPVDDEKQWTYPPFSGTVADGRIWGRGASDMKGTIAAQIMALVILKRSGVALDGDLIVAAAADEESGGEYGFGWLAQNAPETIRAEFALNEGGGSPVHTKKGFGYGIAVGEKGRLEVRIRATGKASHAAAPWQGDNAAFKLAEILKRLSSYEPEIDLSQEFFAHLPPLFERDDPITPDTVDAFADEISAENRAFGSAVRGLSRMTFTPTMLAGGVKSNSVPAAATLVCDVRTLPNQGEAFVRKQVETILHGIEGTTYELSYTAIPNASMYDTPLAAATRRATAWAAGRDDLVWFPTLTTGFTDSRFVRPLGTIAYGFTPSHPDTDPRIPANAHGANESIDILSLRFRTKFFIAVALDLLGRR